MSSSNALEELRSQLDAANRVVVFTGAGISTESGIPDFRSPGGIWSRLKPVEFRDFVASVDARREAWRRKFEIDRDFEQAQPNRGHRAVAELVKRGKCTAVITQNIDGLHQRSGIDETHVIELHGNGTYARCLACGLRHELEPIKQAFLRDETLPECGDCGGLVKAATISFGQAMPRLEMQLAQEAARSCDLFLVLGSSLVVYPAAGVPLMAVQSGASLVIVNREPTAQDVNARLVIHAAIGDTLGAAVGVE
jgi:NAD-dependent deacetylase